MLYSTLYKFKAIVVFNMKLKLHFSNCRKKKQKTIELIKCISIKK